jgi:hypothetical protein
MELLKYLCILSISAAGLLAGWWRCVHETPPQRTGDRWHHYVRAWLSHINGWGWTVFVAIGLLTILVFLFDWLDKRDFDAQIKNLTSASSEIRDVANSSLTKISAASEEVSAQTARMQAVADVLAQQQITLAQTALRGISTHALTGQQAAYDGMNQLQGALFTYMEGRLDAQIREISLVTGADDEATYQRDALELTTYTVQMVTGLLDLAKKLPIPTEDKAVDALSKLLAQAKELEKELKSPQQKSFVYQRLRVLRAVLIQSRYNATIILVTSHGARTKEVADQLTAFETLLDALLKKDKK